MSTKNLHTVEKIIDDLKNCLGYRKDIELARWIGVSNKLLWNWKHKNAIGDLNAFIRKGVSESWLRTGKGEMFISPSEATPEQWEEYEAGRSFGKPILEDEWLEYAKQLEEVLGPVANKFDRKITWNEALKMIDEKVKILKREDD